MDDVEEILVEERTMATIPTPNSASHPTPPIESSRYFLLPRAVQTKYPLLPTRPPNSSPVPTDGLNVDLAKSWVGSPELWRRWISKLRPRHEALWREIGILDGVAATCCRVKRDEATLLQLASFWCTDSNTFRFPWGEATVTLEDMAVLGGLPVLGKCVRHEPPEDILADIDALERHRLELGKTTYKKATYSLWVRHFMDKTPEDEDGEHVEHAAFLAMWLSRFALKDAPFEVVRPVVFPIAARMAQGQAVALAPAALASLYRGLSALKKHMTTAATGEAPAPFVVGGPLHILQLWVWERFPGLRPETLQSSTMDGVHSPRAALWDNAQYTVIDATTAHAKLVEASQFNWMPYSTSADHCILPAQLRGSWVYGEEIAASKKLQTFARCIHACDLLGMSCNQRYRPHHVARQLGYDQDVPGIVARSAPREAWLRYNMKAERTAFFVPDSEPGVTVEYLEWWKYSPILLQKPIVLQNGCDLPDHDATAQYTMIPPEHRRRRSKKQVQDATARKDIASQGEEGTSIIPSGRRQKSLKKKQKQGATALTDIARQTEEGTSMAHPKGY